MKLTMIDARPRKVRRSTTLVAKYSAFRKAEIPLEGSLTDPRVPNHQGAPFSRPLFYLWPTLISAA